MRRISVANMAKRLVVYCIGLFLMAVGVSISIKSDLGVSPVNSIPYVVSEIVKSISMGTWTTIIYCVFILTQLCDPSEKIPSVQVCADLGCVAVRALC